MRNEQKIVSQAFEDQYFNQLRTIELAIYHTYREHADLADYQVDKVLNDLERTYKAEQIGRKPPRLKHKPLEENLYQRVAAAMALYLGRDPEIQAGDDFINLDEAIACLKRIQRSVQLMTGHYRGRQGYLDFIADFFTDA